MVVVFGTVCLDRVRRLPRLPAPGGYVETLDEKVFLGGEAANTALALRGWGGVPVLASNPLGDDADGEDLRRRVAASGLELVELRGAARVLAPVCDVFVTPDGERTMIGRGFSVLDDRIDLDALPLRADGLFAAEPNFAASSREALRRAGAVGMRTYLMDFLEADEPVGPNAVWQASAEDVGARGDAEAGRAFVDAHVARTGALTILTDGPCGLVAGMPGFRARLLPAFPVPSVVDTTGAGDVFRAGMLHGLDRGWATGACLQFASAAGALAVGHHGASTRLPTLSEIAETIAENPNVAQAYV